MEINRRYKIVKKSELPKKLSIFKRIMCEHELVDDELVDESGLFRLNGQDHIVYCEKCGHIEGYWSKEFD